MTMSCIKQDKLEIVIFPLHSFLPSIYCQNIREIPSTTGPPRFRLMMSDGLHSLSCKDLVVTTILWNFGIFLLKMLFYKFRNACFCVYSLPVGYSVKQSARREPPRTELCVYG